MSTFFPWPVFWYLTTGDPFPSTEEKQSRFLYEDPSLGPDPVSIVNRGITFYVD